MVALNPAGTLTSHIRDWLQRSGIAGLTDEETQAQLAGVRYRHSPAGRVEIESKEDAKKRGQSSPDPAEALVPACVQVVPREQTLTFGGNYSISPISWRLLAACKPDMSGPSPAR